LVRTSVDLVARMREVGTAWAFGSSKTTWNVVNELIIAVKEFGGGGKHDGRVSSGKGVRKLCQVVASILCGGVGFAPTKDRKNCDTLQDGVGSEGRIASRSSRSEKREEHLAPRFRQAQRREESGFI